MSRQGGQKEGSARLLVAGVAGSRRRVAGAGRRQSPPVAERNTSAQALKRHPRAKSPSLVGMAAAL